MNVAQRHNAPLLHSRIIGRLIELRAHHHDSMELMSSSGTPRPQRKAHAEGERDVEKSIGIIWHLGGKTGEDQSHRCCRRQWQENVRG
jgi:hypothetical protein